MREDDIMRELRQHRAKLAKRFGYDLNKLADYYNSAAAELIDSNGRAKPPMRRAKTANKRAAVKRVETKAPRKPTPRRSRKAA